MVKPRRYAVLDHLATNRFGEVEGRMLKTFDCTIKEGYVIPYYSLVTLVYFVQLIVVALHSLADSLRAD